MVSDTAITVSGRQIVGFAEPDREPHRHGHQEPIDDADIDLAIAVRRRLLDPQSRSQPSWIACRVIEKAPGDDRLAGNDGGNCRQQDQR